MSGRNARRAVMRAGIGVLIVLLLVAPGWVVIAAPAADANIRAFIASDTPPGGTPQQVAVGASVTLSLTGFSPIEFISLWQTGPDSAVTPLPGTQTDGKGGFSVTVSFPSAGNWSVTAHGKTSGKETVTAYRVGDLTTANATPGTPAPAPAPANAPAASAPAGNSSQVAVGSSVTFAGAGFTANEQVSMWETAPDSSVTPLPGTSADGTGAVMVSVAFPTAGQWSVTAHGKTSGKETVAYYTAGSTTDSATSSTTGATTGTGSTPPLSTSTSSSPAPASASTTASASGSNALQVDGGLVVKVGSSVRFSGAGFRSGETVTVWEIGPGNLIQGLPSITAGGDGTVSFPVTFPNEGPWQIAATGQSSGRAVIAPYRAVSSS